MAVPQIGGSASYRFASTSATIDVSAVPTGGWMLVTVMSSSNTMNITPPAGWATLKSSETTGTRRNFAFGKLKEASDGASVIFTQSALSTTAYSLLWGANALDVGFWAVGSSSVRSDSGEPLGARYINTAPGVTTLSDESLVIAISHEATNAKAQADEVASVTPSGWTRQLWLEQVSVGVDIETIWIATREQIGSATTEDTHITYTSLQDFNGWGVQIAIPSAPPPTLEQPTIIGTPTVTKLQNGTQTGISVTRPSGAMNGDYIVVALRSQSSATSIPPASPGFTRLGPAFSPSDSAHRVVGFYGRPISDITTEPTSYDFSIIANANFRTIAAAFIVRGVDIENPVAGFDSTYNGYGVTGGRNIYDYTVTHTPALALALGSAEFSASFDHTPLTVPAGYIPLVAQATSDDMGVSRTYLWVGSQDIQSSSVSSAGITWTSPSGVTVEGIALRGTSEPIPVEGLGFTARNGSGQEVKMYYTTSDGPRTPSQAVPIRRGFSSVTEMLATPGFTWAHRGGSASYPEHSLYAYTQSVARGYGVLEVSFGRTSDGVWFGLHDQTTDYTSGGTYGNASDQTWAQIQAQQIVVGGSKAPQPYMRWDELVAAYGATHLFVVDIKYAWNYEAEFLTMILNDIGTERAIVKTFAPSSGGANSSAAAQALGFKTWGYFYASDASAALGGSGGLQTYGAAYDFLGMEHGASQAVWDEALAFGKPVIGHIAATQAAYNAAMSKGASGVQVSGVAAVAPVSWWTQ